MDREEIDELELPVLESAAVHEVPDTVVCMALSPNKQRVAVGTFDEGISILDAQLQLVHKLVGHKGGTLSLGWANDGLLVSAGEDGCAKLWDAASGAIRTLLECEGENADKGPDGHTVTNVAISADGKLAACSAGKTVHVIEVDADDVEAARRIFPPMPGGVVEALRFTPAGALLAAYYGGVSVLGTMPDVPSMELPYQTAIYSVAATPTLEWVVGGCMDSCVHIWHLTPAEDGTGAHMVEFSCGGYEGKVTAVDFHQQTQQMASAGGVVNTVWDFSGEGPAGTMPTVCVGHGKPITCQAWQPGLPGRLVTGARDGRVLIFDPRLRVEDEEGEGPSMSLPVAVAHTDDEVSAVAWGGRGLLYSAHSSGMVRCWLLPGASAPLPPPTQSPPGSPPLPPAE